MEREDKGIGIGARTAAGPFLVKLFYRTGAFHRTDEFASARQLPFVPAHVFSTCSLTQLSHFLAASQDPVVLPSPAVGTRIAFRLVRWSNSREREASRVDGSSGLPRISIQDLGSVVIGGGGPGAPTSLSSLESIDDYDLEDLDFDARPARTMTDGDASRDGGNEGVGSGARDEHTSGSQTLADVRFAVGDCISCAIMPPLANGCVVSAGDIRSGRGCGVGEASAESLRPPPPPPPPLWKQAGASGSRSSRDIYPRAGNRGHNSGPAAVLTGDWRRGDTLPETGVWVRDGGRLDAPSSNGGGFAGWPGSRRRRNGR